MATPWWTKEKIMNPEQIQEFMQVGEWVSIAPEIRPSSLKNPDGSLKPFYLTRAFKYSAGDTFELEVVNSADSYGNIPLARILIKRHIERQGPPPTPPCPHKVIFIPHTFSDLPPF